MFKKVNKKMLRLATEKVNLAIKFIDTSNITQTNDLIRAESVWVAEELGLKRIAWREKNEPKWKRRIQGDIKRLRQDLNLLERERKGELGKRRNRMLKNLEEKYRVKSKGIKTVIEELQQRMIAKSAKIKRYEQRTTQFRQNRMFYIDQKKIYTELNNGGKKSSDVPDAENSRRFWSDIWSTNKQHNKEAQLLKEMQNENRIETQQEAVEISLKKVTNQCKKIPNWKAPRKDGVQRYWIKSLSSLH